MQAHRHILADHHANEPPAAYTGFVVTVALYVAEGIEADRKRHYKKRLRLRLEANYQFTREERRLYECQDIH